MLIGEYFHTIDTKKRLALPAKFRKELGKSLIVTRGVDNCLVVYTEQEWKKIAEKLAALPESRPEARTYRRLILAGAMLVSVDKLGRVLIPENLKDYAGLEKRVVVCGLFNRLEIWDSDSWERYRGKEEKKVDDLASKLGELGV